MALTARRPEGEQGFLYVEVLAAMVLLGFVLVTTGTLMMTAVRENTAARDLTCATTLAQDKAETLKRAHYATLSSGSDTVVMRSMPFDRVWTVTDNSPYAYMRTVSVRVTPRRLGSGHGGSRAATVSFYRAPI